MELEKNQNKLKYLWKQVCHRGECWRPLKAACRKSSQSSVKQQNEKNFPKIRLPVHHAVAWNVRVQADLGGWEAQGKGAWIQRNQNDFWVEFSLPGKIPYCCVYLLVVLMSSETFLARCCSLGPSSLRLPGPSFWIKDEGDIAGWEFWDRDCAWWIESGLRRFSSLPGVKSSIYNSVCNCSEPSSASSSERLPL